MKIKCTLEDPMTERVKAIRRHLDGKVVLDPNERFYHPAGTVQVARELGAFANQVVFESPVPQDRLDWYLLLRRKIDIPIALHLIGARVLLEALRKDVADMYNLSTGSPTDFVFCARMCELAGCPVWHGSRMDLGILDMAHIHASAAAPACTLPGDVVGNFMREDDLIREPIQYRDGCALVPDRPGLGVELDEEALERHRQPLENGLPFLEASGF